MIDAVLSYHMNPLTCGVAKFNRQLAERLGVPHRPWASIVGWTEPQCPLLSIKSSEVANTGLWLKRWPVFDLFLHDTPSVYPHLFYDMVEDARTVYAANPVIADELKRFRPDVITAWCPSTLQGNPTRGSINVLTFGMAHKIQTVHHLKLRALLDATGRDYTVSASCAIHEGSPWSETWQETEAILGGIYGDKLRVLGFLADDALSREISDCSAVALFYDPALRSNNTTFWGAVFYGAPVITNLDMHSPSPSRVYDIDDMVEWPDALVMSGLPPGMGWNGLIEKIRAAVAA